MDGVESLCGSFDNEASSEIVNLDVPSSLNAGNLT